MKINRENITIICIGSFLFLPSIYFGIYSGHDAAIHVRWIEGFYNILSLENIYPRWMHDSNEGFGAPVFFYYPPLPYYFSSIFLSIGIGDSNQALSVSFMAASIFGAYGIYFYVKSIFNKNSALLASLLFFISPYNYIINAHFRAAYAEFIAIALIAWILFSIEHYRVGHKKSYLSIIFFTTLLLFTHPPTSLICIPLLFFYTLIRCYKGKGFSFYLTSLSAFIIPFLISAIYLIPALFLNDNLVNRDIMFELYNYKTNFLPSFSNKFKSLLTISLFLFFIVFLLSSIYIFLFDKNISKFYFYTLIFLISIVSFFLTGWSSYFWNEIPLLAKVQFPWRMLSVLALVSNILIAYLYFSITKYNFLGNRLSSVIKKYTLPAICLFVLCAFLISLYFRVNSDDEIFNKVFKSEVPEYQVQLGNGSLNFPIDGKISFLKNKPEKLEIVQWESRHIVIKTKSKEDYSIGLRQAHFTEWSAISQKTGQLLKTQEHSFLKIVKVDIPKGTHTIEIKMTMNIYEKVGSFISFLSIILVFSFFVYFIIKTRIERLKIR